MSKAFLNHKSEDKTLVLAVQKYLSKCLIPSWLDNQEMHGGSKLNASIIDGINSSPFFIAFISKRYTRSNWCMFELEEAQRLAMEGGRIIIPVLLEENIEALELQELSVEHRNQLTSLLNRYKYISFDKFDPKSSMEEIADSIAEYNKIKFYPITVQNLQGTEIQLIELKVMSTGGNLPVDFLKSFELNIENDFLAYRDDQPDKPLRAGKPIAFNGVAPNWLYAYLTISFKNLCPVYLFNNTIPGYVCCYDSARPPKRQGTVLVTD